jgi:hypothetical protein
MAPHNSGNRTIGTRIKAFIGTFIELLGKAALVAAPDVEDEGALEFYLMLDRIDG